MLQHVSLLSLFDYKTSYMISVAMYPSLWKTMIEIKSSFEIKSWVFTTQSISWAKTTWHVIWYIWWLEGSLYIDLQLILCHYPRKTAHGIHQNGEWYISQLLNSYDNFISKLVKVHSLVFSSVCVRYLISYSLTPPTYIFLIHRDPVLQMKTLSLVLVCHDVITLVYGF